MINRNDDPFYRPRPLPPLDLPSAEFTLFEQRPPGGSGSSNGDALPPPKPPIDEEQEADHPFAIKVKITGKALDSDDWTTADVRVLSGTYSTSGGSNYNANGAAFPAEAYSSSVGKSANGSFNGFVYLYIPLEKHESGVSIANGSAKVRAIDGGEVRLRATPATEWPNAVVVGSGLATAVRIGTWSVARVNTGTGGVDTFDLRIQIEQSVKDNIVLGDPDTNDDAAKILPPGEATNDLAYWDHEEGEKKWKKLDAPATSGTFVLGVKDGVLSWLPTKDC